MRTNTSPSSALARHSGVSQAHLSRDASPHRIKRLSAALLAFFLCFTGLIVAPHTARADDSPIRVTLTSITPNAVSTSGQLTLTGTITNTSSSAIDNPSVQMWRNTAPITNADALHLALNETQPAAMTSVVNAASARDALSTLAPGASVNFSVSAGFSDGDDPLSLVSPGNGYLVGVRVTNSSGSQIGASRAFIPYLGDHTYVTTTVAVLASTPSLVGGATGSAVFTDDHLAAEISGNGQLSRIAQLAETDGVSTIIDPLLVDELSAMAAGYTVRDAQGHNVAGTGQHAASDFLNRLSAIANNGRCYRGLYGMLNIATTQAADRTDLLTRAAEQSAKTSLVAKLPLVVTATNAVMTTEDFTFLSTAKPQIVLAAGLSPSHPVQSGDKDSPNGTITVVAADETMGDGGPSPTPSDDLIHRVGRLQTEQLIRSQNNTSIVNVVTTGDAADAELTNAAGRQRRNLSDFIGSNSQVPLSADPLGTATPVNAQDLSSLTAAEEQAINNTALYSKLTGNDSHIDTDLLAVQGWSSTFPSIDQASHYLDAAASPFSTALNSGQVEVHIAQKLVVGSHSSSVPVSLTNTKSISVKVLVHFESDNSSRLSIPDTSIITLDPGESATVRISPQATSSGTVQVNAVVMTAGSSPLQLGEPVRFTVQTNDNGPIGWAIIIASGVVLLGATALRVRQVRRERANQQPGADEDPDVPFDPAPLID